MKRTTWAVLLPALVGLVSAHVGLALAAAAPRATLCDLALSTARWSWGFGEGEEPLPATFRWSRARAGLELPLDTAADAADAGLELRAARFVGSPARIAVIVNGVPFGEFDARPGGFRRHQLHGPLPAGPLTIELRSDDPERGVALDWVRVSGVPLRIPWRVPWARLGPAALGAALGLAGAAAAPAAAFALAASLVLAALAAAAPFATAHALAVAGAPATLSLLVVALGVRARHAPFGLVIVFAVSLALKASALFHPSYFYPDARQNHRLVHALARETTGSIETRTRAVQERLNVAYPRTIAGRSYAFPYSAVFYLPFTGIESPEDVVAAIAAVALVAAALECVATFALASPLLGASGGLLAAAASLLLPPLQSRLLYAMWSTVAGHLLDVGCVLALAAWLSRPTSGRLGRLWATAQAALLVYVSSLLNLGALAAGLLLALALLRNETDDGGRRLDLRLGLRGAGALAAAAILTVSGLYGHFLWLFVSAILPAVLAGVAVASGGGSAAPPPGLLEAVVRAAQFVGPLAAGLAVVGLGRLLQVARGGARVALLAYLLAFALLVALRAFGGGLFRDLKEVEFAAPLLATGIAAALAGLAGHGLAGRAAAALLGLALAASFAQAWLALLARHTPLAGS